PLPVVQFVAQDPKARRLDVREMKLIALRKDLAGEAVPLTISLGAGEGIAGRLTLLPGRWAVALLPGPNYYVAGFQLPGAENPVEGRADGWNDLFLPAGAPQAEVKFLLSSSPAAIAGSVHNAKGDPVANIPIFIEPDDLAPEKRLPERRSLLSDGQGRYTIGGLAPGAYRLLATFEYESPESSEF